MPRFRTIAILAVIVVVSDVTWDGASLHISFGLPGRRRIVQFVFLLACDRLRRLGRRAAARAAGRPGGLSRGLSLFAPVLRPLPEFVHAIFDLGAKHTLRELQELTEEASARRGRPLHLVAESDMVVEPLAGHLEA